MALPSEEDNGLPTGQQTPTSTWGKFNNISFLVQQAIGKIQTSTIVKVISCTNAGTLDPVGFVNVLPLVNQVDGAGNSIPHQTIFNIPYIRIQGGGNAVIIDPEPGDIGLCVFSSRDITKIKKTKAQANPGSYRQYNFADGMYLGGMLNTVPTQYIKFDQNGIKIYSPTQINVEAPDAQINCTDAQVNCSNTSIVTAATSADITSPIIRLGATGQTLRSFVNSLFQAIYNGHTHNETGTITSAPNQKMTSSELTTTVKGG